MFTSSQLSRSVAVAVAVASLGAGTAVARPADDAVVLSSGPVVSARAADDLRSPDAVDAAGRVAVSPPARHEGLGVTPAAPAPVVTDVPAAPLTVAENPSGIDWLSVAIGASALLALLLTGALLRAHHPRVPRVRPRAS
jgi:hypothetical protein